MVEFRVCGFEMAHWADVAALFLAPECCWGTLQMPLQSRDAIKRKLENPPERMHRLVAVTEDEDRAVGLISLCQGQGRRSHAGEVAMWVHPELHNQGIGTALLGAAVDLGERWLDLKRIELNVFVDNQPAIRLYEKFGFVVEGTARKYAYRNGEYVDVLLMARVR